MPKKRRLNTNSLQHALFRVRNVVQAATKAQQTGTTATVSPVVQHEAFRDHGKTLRVHKNRKRKIGHDDDDENAVVVSKWQTTKIPRLLLTADRTNDRYTQWKQRYYGRKPKQAAANSERTATQTTMVVAHARPQDILMGRRSFNRRPGNRAYQETIRRFGDKLPATTRREQMVVARDCHAHITKVLGARFLRVLSSGRFLVVGDPESLAKVGRALRKRKRTRDETTPNRPTARNKVGREDNNDDIDDDRKDVNSLDDEDDDDEDTKEDSNGNNEENNAEALSSETKKTSRRFTVHKKVPCQHCGNLFFARGVKPHEKRCRSNPDLFPQGNKEEEQLDDDDDESSSASSSKRSQQQRRRRFKMSVEFSYPCKHCGRMFSPRGLRMHESICKPCQYCGKYVLNRLEHEPQCPQRPEIPLQRICRYCGKKFHVFGIGMHEAKCYTKSVRCQIIPGAVDKNENEYNEDDKNEDEENGDNRKKQCDICGEFFPIRGGFGRHYKYCAQNIAKEEKQTEKECPLCGNIFQIARGGFKKHFNACAARHDAAIADNTTEDEKEAEDVDVDDDDELDRKPSSDEKQCLLCGNFFKLARGGYWRHYQACARNNGATTTNNDDEVSLLSMDDDDDDDDDDDERIPEIKTKQCEYCGNHFNIHGGLHSHLRKCSRIHNGIKQFAATTSSLSSSPAASLLSSAVASASPVEAPHKKASVRLKKCGLCGKFFVLGGGFGSHYKFCAAKHGIVEDGNNKKTTTKEAPVVPKQEKPPPPPAPLVPLVSGELVWVTQGKTDHMANYMGNARTQYGIDEVEVKWSANRMVQFVPRSSVRSFDIGDIGRKRRKIRTQGPRMPKQEPKQEL